MTNIIKELKRQYIENEVIQKSLQGSDIKFIDAFLNNWNNIEEFYTQYYSNKYPKVVV